MKIYINNTNPISVHQRKNGSILQARWCFKVEYFLTYEGEQARWKLCIINFILIFPFSTTNFFFFPWLFNTPSKPKARQVLFTTFSNIPECTYTGIFIAAKRHNCNQSLHTKGCVSGDTLNISKHSRILITGTISAPPTALSFCHCCVYTSDFALGKLVDLEIFAQNLLTELFYFLKVWSRRKGQGQYVQSMYFLRFFVNKKCKMLFLFFC